MMRPPERARRERAAYEDGVHERSDTWHRRAAHVLEGPNTRRGEEVWEALIREAVGGGGRVLDVGCGSGVTGRQALHCGASYVLGVEISERQLERAQETAIPGRLEFRVADANEPIDVGPFDLVIGRSVLHHLDLREFIDGVAANKLSPGGRMLWMEPLAHPLALAFHKLVRSAHTRDEFPLLPSDLSWIRARFPGTRIIPIDYLSFPAGVLSTWIFPSAENALLRAADSIDRRLAGRVRLIPFARQGIIAIPPQATVPVDDAQFQSLLEQVRELHRLADEVTRERARIDANVRARLNDRHAPHLPPQQQKIADEAVEALSKSRLSSSQSKRLNKAFFGR